MMKLITDRVTTLYALQEELPLTAAQCRVLAYLQACGGGPVSQKAFERHLGVTHTTVKGLLQRLEEKGFVRTAFDCDDGRVKNAYLTEKAEAFREKMMRNTRNLQERILDGITPSEREQLAQLLGRIYDNVK